MTKSTITREQVIALTAEHSYDSALVDALEHLLSTMDSEPVILYRQVNPANGMKTYWAELDPEEFRHLKKYTDENAEFMTLYRHAQQPVVPDEVTAEDCPAFVEYEVAEVDEAWSRGFNACRAAMLNQK